MSYEPNDSAPRIINATLQAAVTDMNLDARYSEEAIAARLRVLEDEARELKRLCDGDL
jgi:hypothetical protein